MFVMPTPQERQAHLTPQRKTSCPPVFGSATPAGAPSIRFPSRLVLSPGRGQCLGPLTVLSLSPLGLLTTCPVAQVLPLSSRVVRFYFAEQILFFCSVFVVACSFYFHNFYPFPLFIQILALDLTCALGLLKGELPHNLIKSGP